jgi:hypothetical protein
LAHATSGARHIDTPVLFVTPAGAWPPAVGAGDGDAAGGGTGAGVAPPLLLPVSEKSVALLPQPTSVMGTDATTCCTALLLPLAACVSPSTEGVTDAELSACGQSRKRQHAHQHMCGLLLYAAHLSRLHTGGAVVVPVSNM